MKLSCRTNPIRDRSDACVTAFRSCPSMVIMPFWGSIKRIRSRNIVLLPEPLGPTNAT